MTFFLGLSVALNIILAWLLYCGSKVLKAAGEEIKRLKGE